MATYKVPKRDTNRDERIAFWRKVIADQEKSGLSASAFCKEHSLQSGLFYAWRTLVQKKDNTNYIKKYDVPTRTGASLKAIRSFWFGVIKDQRQSGLGISAFCEKYGLDRNVYYQWVYRHKNEPLTNKASEQDNPAFMPVTMSNGSEGGAKITIEFENGNSISLTTQNISGILNELVKQIGAN